MKKEIIVAEIIEPYTEARGSIESLNLTTTLAIRFEALIVAKLISGYKLTSWQHTSGTSKIESIIAVFELEDGLREA